ncbi:MAG: Uma2 family endonuclease [Spirochaetes bacterium]|nr:Uma2 family endonuclease [Spirochaetota bacterium]
MKGIHPELLKALEDPRVGGAIDTISVERYHAQGKAGELPEKTELLEGFVFNIMPKSALHSNIIRRVVAIFGKLLSKDFVLSQESPLTIAAVDSEPEPDIMVCRANENDFWEKHPTTADLVVEIAVSSVNLDRYKAHLYATAGVKEYWIVLADERKLEIHTEPQNGKYMQSRIVTGFVASTAVPAIEFELAAILPPPALKP